MHPRGRPSALWRPGRAPDAPCALRRVPGGALRAAPYAQRVAGGALRSSKLLAEPCARHPAGSALCCAPCARPRHLGTMGSSAPCEARATLRSVRCGRRVAGGAMRSARCGWRPKLGTLRRAALRSACCVRRPALLHTLSSAHCVRRAALGARRVALGPLRSAPCMRRPTVGTLRRAALRSALCALRAPDGAWGLLRCNWRAAGGALRSAL